MMMDHEMDLHEMFHDRATSTPSAAQPGVSKALSAPSAPQGGARLSATDVQNGG